MKKEKLRVIVVFNQGVACLEHEVDLKEFGIFSTKTYHVLATRFGSPHDLYGYLCDASKEDKGCLSIFSSEQLEIMMKILSENVFYPAAERVISVLRAEFILENTFDVCVVSTEDEFRG